MHITTIILLFTRRNLSIMYLLCAKNCFRSWKQDIILDVKISLALPLQTDFFFYQTPQALSFIYDNFLCFYKSKDSVLASICFSKGVRFLFDGYALQIREPCPISMCWMSFIFSHVFIFNLIILHSKKTHG